MKSFSSKVFFVYLFIYFFFLIKNSYSLVSQDNWCNIQIQIQKCLLYLLYSIYNMQLYNKADIVNYDIL